MIVIASRAMNMAAMSCMTMLVGHDFGQLAQQRRRIKGSNIRGQSKALPFQPLRQFAITGHAQMIIMSHQMHMHLAELMRQTQQISHLTAMWRRTYQQHRFLLGFDPQQGAVFSHQHIAASQRGARRQAQTQLAALAVTQVRFMMLPGREGQSQHPSAFEQHRCQPGTLR